MANTSDAGASTKALTLVRLPDEGEDYREIPLAKRGGLEKSVHLLDHASAYALNAALIAGRPLLLRGQPGVGKSQLARAAADCLDRAFVHYTVNSRTETDDLLWQVDLVARLAEAQICGGDRTRLLLHNFVRPGPLWWGFNWTSARARLAAYHAILSGEAGDPAAVEVEEPDDASPNGVVVLIDEIDKADSAIPNGLLDTLGHRGFSPPGVPRVHLPEKAPAPLIIFTTNEERHLPDAFLRRCFVHTMALPKTREELQTDLARRGRAHSARGGWQLDEAVIMKAAEIIAKDRLEHAGAERYRPGVAEYLDLLAAVRGSGAPMELLDRIAGFVLRKQAE